MCQAPLALFADRRLAICDDEEDEEDGDLIDLEQDLEDPRESALHKMPQNYCHDARENPQESASWGPVVGSSLEVLWGISQVFLRNLGQPSPEQL